jgi:hypothetical protein
MHSRITRTLIAVFFAVFVAVSASAAPEGRSESRDWLGRQINRIVQQLMKVFAPSPFEDPILDPPKP